MKNWIKLVIALVIPQVVAGMAALFTVTGEGSWYRTIQKPNWNPPNWLFAPVWTTLYILMGIAFFLIWKSTAATVKKRKAMLLWSVQLLFNFLWSLLFFNQHLIGVALADIVLLWLAILLTIVSFSTINKVAAWLLVPYISWVTFAALLNAAIWKLNVL